MNSPVMVQIGHGTKSPLTVYWHCAVSDTDISLN